MLSKEELEDRIEEGKKIGKNCEVGIYGFSCWRNLDPVEESVILDKVVYTGTRDSLEELGETKFKEGYRAILLFDGENYLLFTNESRPLQEVQDTERVKVVRNLKKKFVYPGCVNLKTGKVSRVERVWK